MTVIIKAQPATGDVFFSNSRSFAYHLRPARILARAEVSTRIPERAPVFEYTDTLGNRHGMPAGTRITGTTRFRSDIAYSAVVAGEAPWASAVLFSDPDAVLSSPAVYVIVEGTCPQGEYVPVLAWLSSGAMLLQLKSIVRIPTPEHIVIDFSGTEYEIVVGSNIDLAGYRVYCRAIGAGFACIEIVQLSAIISAPEPIPVPIPEPEPEPPWDFSGFYAFFKSLWGKVSWYLGRILRPILSILEALRGILIAIQNLPDTLDAWVSRLFGIDPKLPFWDELSRKIKTMLMEWVDELFKDYPEKKP